MNSKSRQNFLSKDDHPRLNKSKSSSHTPTDYHHSKATQKNAITQHRKRKKILTLRRNKIQQS